MKDNKETIYQTFANWVAKIDKDKFIINVNHSDTAFVIDVRPKGMIGWRCVEPKSLKKVIKKSKKKKLK